MLEDTHTHTDSHTPKIYPHTTVSAESAAQSIWDDREFVIAIAVSCVAFICLLLLLLVTCILIYYCHKFNRMSKYGIGRSLAAVK